MLNLRSRIIQLVSVIVVQALAIMFVAWLVPGIQVFSFPTAVTLVIAASLAQAIFWFVFVRFLYRLPTLVYPLVTFILTGAAVALVANLLLDVRFVTIADGLWLVIILTVVNAILGAIFSLDEDASFDRNVTRQLVQRHGNPTRTTVPGILYLEIDGLGEGLLRQALEKGYMPTLKRWLDEGKYQITGWETDFSSQTGAMQVGILEGNNNDVPAYRWWDRTQGRIILSGSPRDSNAIETRLTSGQGLCADGGASRGNMFSGDATESLFTFSTLVNRRRGMGPGFYLYLFSPYVIARLVSRYIIEIFKEWWQAWVQRRQHARGKVKYTVSARNPAYAFFRGFMGPILQDLTTYAVISDVLRGLPAVYALYAGYDDLGHFTGMNSPEAFEALHETDRYFARIERAIESAPRPYHVVVLSDHGQSIGPTFKAAYGVSLDELVEALAKAKGAVFASLDTNEGWDNLNAVLSESINSNTRTAGLIRSMLTQRTKNEIVEVGPERDAVEANRQEKQAHNKEIVVLASGCAGLIYFRSGQARMTQEQIQSKYPELIPGLVHHPGIGFVLVQSAAYGPIALGKKGVYYLSDDKVEGENPLAIYGPNAARHLRRETGFADCPDILVNSAYDPQTMELPGFENQVSHHGGLGGPQNHPFIFHPTALATEDAPIVTAVGCYQVLHAWRKQLQSG